MSVKCDFCDSIVPDDIKTCPHCGAPIKSVPKPPAAPKQPAPDPARLKNNQGTQNRQTYTYNYQSPSARSTYRTAGIKPVKKSKRGLSLFLSLLFVAELAVAAFRYPGFLREELDDFIAGFNEGFYGEGNTSGSSSGKGNSPSYNTGITDGLLFGTDVSVSDYTSSQYGTEYIGSVKDISISYTAEQLKNAPVYSQPLSQDNYTAELGDVYVDFDRWNIDESDTISMTDLPEVTDDNSGWTLKAYDFTLASGKHDFDTFVTVKIPKTASGDESGSCVHYDSVKGEWEYVYSEESDDGQYYIVYTDSFSPIAERKYKIVIEDLDSETLLDSGIEGALFNETRYSYAPDRMSYPVDLDYKRFWNLVNTQKMLSDKEIEDITRKASEEDYGAKLGMYSDANSSGGAVMDGFTAAGAMVENPVTKSLGGVGYVLNLVFTTLKIKNELDKYGKDYTNWKNWAEGADKHKLDLLSVGIGSVGLFAGGGWGLAVAGLIVYGISMSYSVQDLLYDTRPVAQRAYEKYYEDHFLYFSEDGYNKSDSTFSSKAFYMERPEAIDTKTYAKIEELTNRHDTPSTYGSRLEDALRIIYKEYRIKFYEDGMKPEGERQKTPIDLVGAVTGLYYNYARAFWDQDSQVLYKYMKDFCEKEGSDFNSDFIWPTGAEEEQYIKEFAGAMMYRDRELLKKLYETALTKSREELIAYMENTLRPLLNKTVVFRVNDTAEHLDGEDMHTSIYSVDYKSLDANKGITANNNDPWCSRLELPIRFKDVDDGPVFTPGTRNYKHEWSFVEKTKYYPYTDNFIPKVKSDSDIIYRCNLYHYVMMGSPQYMTFHDVNGSVPDLDVEIKLPETVSENEDIVVTLDVPMVGMSPFVFGGKWRVDVTNAFVDDEDKWKYEDTYEIVLNTKEGTGTIQSISVIWTDACYGDTETHTFTYYETGLENKKHYCVKLKEKESDMYSEDRFIYNDAKSITYVSHGGYISLIKIN